MSTVPVFPRPSRPPHSISSSPSLVSRVLLVAVIYFALLWRSTVKAPDLLSSLKTHWEKRRLMQIVTFTHKALLNYVAQKAVKITVVLMHVSKNAVAGPIDFVSKHSIRVQYSLKSRLDVWLETQVDVVGEKTKQIIGDPFMPAPLLALVNDSVEALLPDAKRLLLAKTDELIRYQAPASRHLAGERVVVVGGSHKGAGSRSKAAQAASAAAAAAAATTGGGLLDTLASYMPTVVVDGASTAATYVPAPVLDFGRALSSYMPDRLRPAGPMEETDVLLDTLDKAAERDAEEEERDGDEEDAELGWADELRARILYASSPCDKTTWQLTREPAWVLLTLLGLAPYGLGTAWWLLMFVLHDKRDEFQLCNFIVGFMFSKFLGGCALLVYGAMLYYLCATRDQPSCHVDGPRVSQVYDGILFFAQALVVWLSYFLLPLSRECRAVQNPLDAYLVEDWERLHAADRPRGGRLTVLYKYHSACVFMVISLGWGAHFVIGQTGWQLMATLYWLKVLFGLLAVPFVLFKIPFINTLLMQVRATGYDTRGRVVIHVRPRVVAAAGPAEQSAQQRLRRASESLLGGLAGSGDEEEEDVVVG
jgi:hypothetical protein